jgi:hypothetical protein
VSRRKPHHSSPLTLVARRRLGQGGTRQLRIIGWCRLRRWVAASVTLVMIAALLTNGGSSAAAASPSTPSRVSATTANTIETTATKRLLGDDLRCEKPTSSVRATLGSSLLGSAEESTGLALLKLLGEGALSFGLDEGLGWLLKMVGGQEKSVDPAELDRQFDQVNTKLDSLAEQQYNDCNTLLAALEAAKVNGDKNTYTTLAGEMGTQIGYLVTYEQDYDAIINALQRNGGSVDALNSGYKNDMKSMISGGPDGLRNIVNTIDSYEEVRQPGADSMISLFSRIMTEEFGYDPYKSHIFPAEFVDAGAAQQGYYAGLVTQAVYLYTNVAHLDFSIGADYTHKNDPTAIVSLVNVAQKDVQAWSSAFADGPPGAGTPGWVSQNKAQGTGTIPADTVLDYRIQADPMLWTDSPVGLNGQSDAPSPYYCGTTAQYCYADRYDGLSQVGDTRLVLPSPDPLATMVADAEHDDLDGWRVPTAGDWSNLIAGATGGLPAWAQSHQLDQFETEKVTSHYGGKDQVLTTIPPLLENVSSDSTPTYDVLTSADPAANGLTEVRPSASLSTQADMAGRLFLTMNFSPTTPPAPFSATATTAKASATLPAEAAVTSDRARSAHGAPNLTVPGPTTFSTPVVCSAGESTDTYTVPDGVGSVQITATGAAGAAGSVTGAGGGTSPGGVGGSVTETVPVTAGQILYVQVGGAAQGTTGGLGGGGNSGSTHSSTANNTRATSGGGGGASGVGTDRHCSHWLVVAGGGGGGGGGLYSGSAWYLGGRGGDGCAGTTVSCQEATNGAQPSGYSISSGRGGGAQPDNHGGDVGRTPAGNPYGTAGEAGATMTGGSGGDANSSYYGGGGGGGGGGYYGGGGGGGAGWNAAGGGGGSGASFAIAGSTDSSYGLGKAGQSGSVTITPIAKPHVPLSLSVSTNALGWDQPLTLTGHFPTDFTGSVGFYNNINRGCDGAPGGQCEGLGVAAVKNGAAVLTLGSSRLGLGIHPLHVSTGDDAHYNANDSAEVTVTVTKATPTISLSISGTNPPAGQQPTSIVAGVPADATGSIAITACPTTGPCFNIGSAPIVDGYATLSTLSPPLSNGTYRVTATYAGDSHYTANTSNTAAVTVGGSTAAQSNPLKASVGSRIARGDVTLSGTALPGTTIRVMERQYRSTAFAQRATIVIDARGTYRYKTSIQRTARFYVTTIDGRRSSTVTANMGVRVTQTLIPGRRSVGVIVRTNPDVHGVRVIFYRVSPGGELTALRTLTLTSTTGVLAHTIHSTLKQITIKTGVLPGDGTQGGVSQARTVVVRP